MFKVGQTVEKKSGWPFHAHVGTVKEIGVGVKKRKVRVRWRGDIYFPAKTNTETWESMFNLRPEQWAKMGA